MKTPEEVTRFWLEDLSPKERFKSDPALDAKIRERFEDLWDAAMAGKLNAWLSDPHHSFAFVILTDQLSRNMFRGQGKAYASDKLARAASKKAISKGWDMRIPEPERSFFYMPLVHSECLADQEQGVRLMCTKLPQTRDGMLPHARAHREVIRQFGRFPYRNEMLGRPSRADELKYIEAGGYAYTFNNMSEAAA